MSPPIPSAARSPALWRPDHRVGDAVAHRVDRERVGQAVPRRVDELDARAAAAAATLLPGGSSSSSSSSDRSAETSTVQGVLVEGRARAAGATAPVCAPPRSARSADAPADRWGLDAEKRALRALRAAAVAAVRAGALLGAQLLLHGSIVALALSIWRPRFDW